MTILSEHEEILSLVNTDNIVVGEISRADIYDRRNLRGYYLRASDGFIMNRRGQLWVPRRTAHKKIKPNGLDFSAGEHVMAGETYDAAMVRGFAEELNLVVELTQLIYFGKVTPRPDSAPYFNQNYLYYSDEVPDYNPDDFSGYEWLMPAKLRARIENGEVAKDSILPALDNLAVYLAQHASD